MGSPSVHGQYSRRPINKNTPTFSTDVARIIFKNCAGCHRPGEIVSTAWYDNSAAAKSNPDPKADVKWGDQTWEKMQYTGILFSPAQAPAQTAAAPGRQR